MRLRQLFESKSKSVGIIFGRFNPPHMGHMKAWEMASENSTWYVGTNKSTQGPKDPLPFDIKVKAMEAVYPEVKGHIVAEQSWLTLASKVYEKHGNIVLNVYTDESWVTKTLIQYNGKEGAHGYYEFGTIQQQATPRLSSATSLRNAVAADDRDLFGQAAGVDPNTLVAGHPFFDVVKHYLMPHAEKAAAKPVKKKVKQPEQDIAAEGVDIGQEWMSDTELDQYVPERLQKQWRELLGYDEHGNPSALWANLTGGYEPDVNDPQHRALMVKVANKWFAAKKIPNVKFFDVKDADDELEWLVQIGRQEVAEGTSIESTLRAVINDIGEPVTNVYDTMKFQAKKYMENHGELDRGFRMVAAGIGGRWVQSMYVGRLQNELYDLCKYNTRRTVELQQFLRGVEADGELEMKRSFGNIANELPRILAKLGQHLNAPQLTKNANRWMQNKAAYEEYIANLELEDEYDEPVVAKSPKNPAIGQQRSQVEDIVNDVLSKLPKKIAGDIRNAIARSPNKLQALQAELQKHGQKNVAEATFKKSPYGRTAASQQRARELLNPPKPPEPKKDEKGVAENAWDRLQRERALESAGVGIITKQNTTVDVNKNTPKKNLKAFRLA